ncbi:MAG: hypothetical protein JXK05_01145 [Campylobacterales bacterium]|nr:hypothetical protein [Campylobacterales bacterium]
MIYVAAVLYGLGLATVVLCACCMEGLLEQATRENGLFETISVGLLLWLAYEVYRGRKRFGAAWMRYASVAFALLAFVAAMEEISWFQHYLGFESGAFFEAHNHQHESNLHNLIPAHIFSSFIYSGVYAFFVFIPLILRLHEGLWRRFGLWMPDVHVSLVTLYGSSFQAFFYDEFGAWFDMATLFFALTLLIAVVSFKQLWTRALGLHTLFVLTALGVLMASYRVFGFFNMQYEIREMFVVFAALLYVRLVQRNAGKAAAAH